MAKQNGSELTWIEVDPTDLSEEAQELYAAYKAQYRVMKEAKQGFERSARHCIPALPGHEIRFGYNFGKLSFANAPVDAAKASKLKISLADYLANAEAAGHRA